MTREMLIKMGYERVCMSLSLEIYAHVDDDGDIHLYEFETFKGAKDCSCGSLLLSKDAFEIVKAFREKKLKDKK